MALLLISDIFLTNLINNPIKKMISRGRPHLQIIISNQFNPYINLAVESNLLDNNKPNLVTLFLWKNRRTVVIGANQNPYTECNVELLTYEGGHIARRRTGGGAVYHDIGNLNFSFITDRNIYDVNKQISVIQLALKAFGLITEISGRNDITYQNRKFSGNAFCYTKNNALHHGTILIKTDIECLRKYLKINPLKLQKNGVKSVASRIINLSEVADITSTSIVPHIIDAFEQIYDDKAVNLDFDKVYSSKVISLKNHIESHNYLFGKWKTFNTKLSAQFSWGFVELDLSIDESDKTIKNIAISSDSLRPSAIETTKKLLNHADIKVMPDIPHNEDEEIIKDIFGMIY